jgi:oligopeptide transport system ATP-binding protein
MPFSVAVMSSGAAVDRLLSVAGLEVRYGERRVLSDVSFDLLAGETLGVVGESGSGKSTLARAILRLIPATQGSIVWRGRDLRTCDSSALQRLRRELQIIFQDPLGSLNPRMTVGETIAEPLRIFEPALNTQRRVARVGEMLERVGLGAGMMDRYPNEFSGGQCQRIGIARAMILSPKLLICDEPVSSLDVSVQGQIVNLLLDLQRDAGTAMLFISHNLALVRHLSHRILVIYSGRLVEIATRDALYEKPIHPYTRALLAAVPPATPQWQRGEARTELVEVEGSVRPVTGCAFRDRCHYALAICAASVPPLEEVIPGHFVACFRARELLS